MDTFRPLDFLARSLDFGISLVRGQDRLGKGKPRHGGAVGVRLDDRSSTDQRLRREQKREDDDRGREITKNFSHGKKAAEWTLSRFGSARKRKIGSVGAECYAGAVPHPPFVT